MRVITWGLIACLLACSTPDPGETPVGAVRAFLEAMERGAWDSDARRHAYDLMTTESREVLQQRADRAEALGGSDLQPWEMLAQGTFRPRFSARRFELEGDEVVVQGPSGGEARVGVAREGEHWRVHFFSAGRDEVPEP